MPNCQCIRQESLQLVQEAQLEIEKVDDSCASNEEISYYYINNFQTIQYTPIVINIVQIPIYLTK